MAEAPESFDSLFKQLDDLASGSFFGAGKKSPRETRDLKTPLRISFAEAVDGGSREVEVERWLACQDCDGSGAPEDAEWEVCRACKGGGKEDARSHCGACLGRGRTSEEKCPACSGQGGLTQHETLAVQVPGGVVEGHELRIPGKGSDLGHGEGPGDHYIVLSVGAHPRLYRRGDDLYATLTLDAPIVAEGGELQVPIPKSQVAIAVEPDTKTGDTVRLVGHGAQKLGHPPTPRPTGALDPYRAPDPSGHRGDLIVIFVRSGEPLPELSHRVVLGVADDAGYDEIKVAYRQQAMRHHPDSNPGDALATRRFDEAAEAFAALTRASSPAEADESGGGMAGGLPIGLTLATVFVLAVIAYALLAR